MKKIFSNFFLTLFFLLNFNFANAGLLNGFNDPPGCGGDNFLPVLNICGRNPQVAGEACRKAGFTDPCNLSDLVETGQRVLVWVISMALLIIPLYIMWIGAQMVWYQKFEANAGMLGKIKARFFEVILYFILMLAAWLIVRLVIEVFQVDDSRVPIFLIDDSGKPVDVRNFDTNR